MPDCCEEGLSADLTPPRVHLTRFIGDTLRIPFQLRNPPVAPATVGTPIDLTGCVVFGAMKPRTGGVETPFQITIVSAVNGQCVALITDEVSDLFLPGLQNFHITVTDSLGNDDTKAAGDVRWLRKV